MELRVTLRTVLLWWRLLFPWLCLSSLLLSLRRLWNIARRLPVSVD